MHMKTTKGVNGFLMKKKRLKKNIAGRKTLVMHHVAQHLMLSNVNEMRVTGVVIKSETFGMKEMRGSRIIHGLAR